MIGTLAVLVLALDRLWPAGVISVDLSLWLVGVDIWIWKFVPRERSNSFVRPLRPVFRAASPASVASELVQVTKLVVHLPCSSPANVASELLRIVNLVC